MSLPKALKVRKIEISNKARNAKVQNIIGFFFVLEAVIVIALMVLGYI